MRGAGEKGGGGESEREGTRAGGTVVRGQAVTLLILRYTGRRLAASGWGGAGRGGGDRFLQLKLRVVRHHLQARRCSR